MSTTNLDGKKDTRFKKGQVGNPTGKGGFQERPEDRVDGRWRKEDSISYQYNFLMRLPLDQIWNFKPKTVAQDIAFARVRAARDSRLGLGDTKEITDRTEGKSPQAIDLTSSDGSMTPTVIIEGVYANSSNFRPDNQNTEADDVAADGSSESS
jgi:hypothetical protein